MRLVARYASVDAAGMTPASVCEEKARHNNSAVHRAIAQDLAAAVAAHRDMASLYGEIAAGRYDVNKVDGGRVGAGAGAGGESNSGGATTGAVEGGGGAQQLLPLHAAVAGYKGALTRFLMAQGANVSQTSGPEGLTPLHIAARSGQMRMCRLLMLRGAAPNVAAAGPKVGWCKLKSFDPQLERRLVTTRKVVSF